MSADDYDASKHANLEVTTTYGVSRAGSVKEAIEKDGTLIIHVTCEFVVHHAARVPVTKTTVMELINDQGTCEENVVETFIMEANND
jgi:2-C-methyl-D-erythritol 4-phosphate cytidylyltransferase